MLLRMFGYSFLIKTKGQIKNSQLKKKMDFNLKTLREIKEREML